MNEAVAVPAANKNGKEEARDETPSPILEHFRGDGGHYACVCCGRRVRHYGGSLGQERIQFRADAIGPATIEEFDPSSGRYRQCRPTGGGLSQSNSQARSRGGCEAEGRARRC